jgi:hypothetical protein
MKASHQVQEFIDKYLIGRASKTQMKGAKDLLDSIEKREEALLTEQIKEDARLKRALDELSLYHEVQAL